MLFTCSRVGTLALTILLGTALSGATEGQDTSKQNTTKVEVSEPIITDRPDVTESAHVVPIKMIQFEGGYTFSRNGAARDHAIGEFLLRIATDTRTELRLGLNSFHLTHGPDWNTNGLEDLSIGFKHELKNGSKTFNFWRPQVALLVSTSLPTGASAYRKNTLQPMVKLAFDWDISKRLDMGANLSYSYASDQGRRFSQCATTFTFGYALTNRLGIFLETFNFLPGGYRLSNANYVDSGLTYAVTTNYQLDARVGRGLNSARPDYFVGAGAAYRW